MRNRIDIDYDLIIEKYNELKNLKKVAKFFGVSLRPIKRMVSKPGKPSPIEMEDLEVMILSA